MQKTFPLIISAYKQISRRSTFPKLYFRADHNEPHHKIPKPVMDDFVDKAEELDMSREKGSRERRGGKSGRGGKRGGGAGGKGEGREIMVSKALSKLLRHAAVEAGLKLDAEGYASVEQVVSYFLHFVLLYTPWRRYDFHPKVLESDTSQHMSSQPWAKIQAENSTNTNF